MRLTSNPVAQNRRRSLRARLTERNKIICVSAQATVVAPSRLFPPDAEECWYAIADGNYNDASFVASPDDRTKGVDTVAPDGNALKLYPIL